MGKKIDYSKAEKEISEAIQKTNIKHLSEGKSITSRRAAEFYGIEEPVEHPAPTDPVEEMLEEAASEEEAYKLSPQETEEGEEPIPEEEHFPSIEETPTHDTLEQHKPVRSTRARPPPPTLPYSETFVEATSPLTVLENHLLWFKQQHVKKRYAQLGTTKEEIVSFQKSHRLSPEQKARIQELNTKAKELKETLLKEQGCTSDETLIKEQQQQHKRKRFHIKKSWTPL